MKRRNSIILIALIIIGLIAIAFVQFQNNSKVSDIISDEAKWDALDSLSAAAQMKVVILQDGTVARYVSEDEDTYSCSIQDSFTVSKEASRVELWSASEGKGIVYLKEPGARPSYSEPDTVAAIVLDLVYEEGCLLETHTCLGLNDGWYKIVMGDTPAYIEAQYVNWDAIDSF